MDQSKQKSNQIPKHNYSSKIPEQQENLGQKEEGKISSINLQAYGYNSNEKFVFVQKGVRKKVKKEGQQDQQNYKQTTLFQKIPKQLQFLTGDGVWDQSIVKISSWNVNGLRAVLKKGELLQYIKDTDPDILCLSEIKIDQEKYEQEKIAEQLPKQYNQYWSFCKPPSSGYSGICILSKIKPISYQIELEIEEHGKEGRLVGLEFQDFYVVTCYVPNSGDNLVRLSYRTFGWDIELMNYLTKLSQKKSVILCGDLNVAHHEIDLANPKRHEGKACFTKEERANFSQLLQKGFIDTFRQKYPNTIKYSFWSQRGNARKTDQGWRLDYFLVTKDAWEGVQDSIIRNDIHGSDHCPIELIFNIDSVKNTNFQKIDTTQINKLD